MAWRLKGLEGIDGEFLGGHIGSIADEFLNQIVLFGHTVGGVRRPSFYECACSLSWHVVMITTLPTPTSNSSLSPIPIA